VQWRRRFPATRTARPKVRRLEKDEREKLRQSLTAAVERSPILRAFEFEVRSTRGRFYLEWTWQLPYQEPVTYTRGRITPLDDSTGKLLLEVEFRHGRWSQIDGGGAAKSINNVAGDKEGTFHGLGSLDQSLRETEKERKQIGAIKKGKGRFVDADSGRSLSVQEALFYCFAMPIQTIAQPTGWYSRHRQPHIAEHSKDRSRVLVRFMTSSLSGESFGGTCLYLKHDSGWGA
jgi:hypothetical protein